MRLSLDTLDSLSPFDPFGLRFPLNGNALTAIDFVEHDGGVYLLEYLLAYMFLIRREG